MKRNVFVAAILAAIVIGIVVFSFTGNTQMNERADGEKQSINIKKLVQDYTLGNLKAEAASITSSELTVTEADKSKSVHDLPEDEFFISIAPYINKTHPCAIHNLTGCQGEMTGEEFEVYIEDADGNEVMDETVESQQNGFIDLWLPRDTAYQITITQGDKTVTGEFSTFEGDDTCVTTMQLK